MKIKKSELTQMIKAAVKSYQNTAKISTDIIEEVEEKVEKFLKGWKIPYDSIKIGANGLINVKLVKSKIEKEDLDTEDFKSDVKELEAALKAEFEASFKIKFGF